MSTPKQPPDDQTIACAVCLKEIPASEATSDEASDYVRHFCGLECYQQWQSHKDEPTAED
jgi:hypothetical protein